MMICLLQKTLCQEHQQLNIQLSLSLYKRLPDFFAVEHALNIKVVKTTSNIFFKFVFNVIFSPRFNEFISNYLKLFKLILHKNYGHFDNKEDQDGSEASVFVKSLLSL